MQLGGISVVRSIQCAARTSVLLLFFFPTMARSATVTWTSTSDGNWSTASNWNSGAGPVPGSTDDAVITLAGTYTVILDVDATVASLTLGGSSGNQTLSSSFHTLTIGGPSTV